MVILRSILFNLYFYAVNILLYIGCIPFLLLGPRASIIGCHIWARAILWGAKYIAGINYKVINKPGKSHVAVFASKHQSAWETAFYWSAFSRPCFVLKQELMYIPFFGLYLYRSGQIWINRSKGASSIKKLLKQTQQRLAEGRQIILFPEGTRTKSGSAPVYKSGVATVYNNIEKPVIPVRLNSGDFWPKGAFIKKPGTIVVEFLEAMPAGLSKQEFMQELQKRIEEKK